MLQTSFVGALALSASLAEAMSADQPRIQTNFQPDISWIKEAVLSSWCPSQRHICGILCGDAAYPNECYLDDLSYKCTCTDGSKPDFSAFAGTLESNACQAYVSQCVGGNMTNPAAQEKCLEIQCGKEDPSRWQETKESEVDDDEDEEVFDSPSEPVRLADVELDLTSVMFWGDDDDEDAFVNLGEPDDVWGECGYVVTYLKMALFVGSVIGTAALVALCAKPKRGGVTEGKWAQCPEEKDASKLEEAEGLLEKFVDDDRIDE